MKLASILVASLCLASCATDPNGNKTFAGLNARGALYLARDVTSSYLLNSGKSGKEVQPVVEVGEPTAVDMPWYLKLLGL